MPRAVNTLPQLSPQQQMPWANWVSDYDSHTLLIYFKVHYISEIRTFANSVTSLSPPSLSHTRSAFAAKKLRVKGGGDEGVGLLYESDVYYDTYTLNVITGPDHLISSVNVLKQGDKVDITASKNGLNLSA